MSLKAKTRLGDDSAVVIPLYDADAFDPTTAPDFAQAKAWFLRAMNVSRKGIVKPLQSAGVPEGWRKSALLRNCYPLRLDAESRWMTDPSIQLSNDLGLVYHDKEAP